MKVKKEPALLEGGQQAYNDKDVDVARAQSVSQQELPRLHNVHYDHVISDLRNPSEDRIEEVSNSTIKS